MHGSNIERLITLYALIFLLLQKKSLIDDIKLYRLRKNKPQVR